MGKSLGLFVCASDSREQRSAADPARNVAADQVFAFISGIFLGDRWGPNSTVMYILSRSSNCLLTLELRTDPV